MSSNTETTKPQRLIAKTIQAELEAAQGRARERTLDESDVRGFIADVKRARAFARRHGIEDSAIFVEWNGGGVCNAYSYRAESSTLLYSGSRVSVSRDYARKGPRGNVDEVIVRIRIGSIADRPELRKARSVTKIHGGYVYL
jgi:hypothetical protein